MSRKDKKSRRRKPIINNSTDLALRCTSGKEAFSISGEVGMKYVELQMESFISSGKIKEIKK